MKTTLTIENIYSMLSSLSVNNKKWLADHLYEDISGVQVRRRRGALSDEELEAELSGSPLLDMNDYEPLTDEQFKGLVHSRPIPISLEKWLWEEYTIKIENEWLSKPMSKQSYFITHIMGLYRVEEVISQRNCFIKEKYFDRIIDKIINSIFG